MILLTCLLCSAATSADIMCLWEVSDDSVVNDSNNKNVLEILHGAFYEIISWEVAHRIKLMDEYKSQYEEMMICIIQNKKDTEVMYKVVKNYVVNSLNKLGYKNLDVDKNRPNIMSGLATMSTKMNKKEGNLDDQRRSAVLFGKFEIESHHLIYIKYMVDCLFLTMAIESYKKDKPAALQFIHKLINDEHNFAREETAVAYSNLVNNLKFKHYFFCFEKVLNDGKRGEHFACWHNGNVSDQSFIIVLKNYTALYKRMFDTYCFKQNTLGKEKNITAESLLIDKLNYVLDSQEQIEKIMKMKKRIKYRFFTEIYILSTSGYGFNLVKSMSRENQDDRNLEDEVQILYHFWNFDVIFDSILIDIFAPRLRETIV